MSWWVEQEHGAHFAIKSSKHGWESHVYRCVGGTSKANWLRDVLNEHEQDMPKVVEMLRYYFNEVHLPEIEKDVKAFLDRWDAPVPEVPA